LSESSRFRNPAGTDDALHLFIAGVHGSSA
jgi:hypothetical protein